jgi:hypothetical protein
LGAGGIKLFQRRCAAAAKFEVRNTSRQTTWSATTGVRAQICKNKATNTTVEDVYFNFTFCITLKIAAPADGRQRFTALPLIADP